MRTARCDVMEMSGYEHTSTTVLHALSLGISLSVGGVVFVEIINS